MNSHGLFVVTVPKAGKNLIYTFLNNLGFKRFDLVANIPKDQAMQATYSAYFDHLDLRATWALPAGACKGELLTRAIPDLLKNICNMPADSYISHHFAFHPELYEGLRKENIPIVFLYRDPRDIILSMSNYFINQQKPEHLSLFFDGLTYKEIMHHFFKGNETLVPIIDYLDAFSGWLDAEGVLCLRFEDIVGPMGGGNAGTQFEKLQQLANLCKWEGSKDELETAILLAFSTRTGTFYRGQVGAWQQVWDYSFEEYVNRGLERLLQLWKYEKEIYENDSAMIPARDYFVEILKTREKMYFDKIHSQNETANTLKSMLKAKEKEISHLQEILRQNQEDSQARLERIKELQQELESQKNQYIENTTRFSNEKLNLEQLLKARDEQINKLTDAYRTNQEDSQARLEHIKELQQELEAQKNQYIETATHFSKEKQNLEQLLKTRDEQINQLNDAYRINREDSQARLERIKELQKEFETGKNKYIESATHFSIEKQNLEQLLKTRDEQINKLNDAFRLNQEDSQKRLEYIKQLQLRLDNKQQELNKWIMKFTIEKENSDLSAKKSNERIMNLQQQLDSFYKKPIRGALEVIKNKVSEFLKIKKSP